MLFKIRLFALPAVVLGTVVLIIFGGVLGSFYEQDEWLGIGNYLTGQTNKFCLNTEKPLGILIGEGRQLSSFITCFSYNYFPFNTAPLAVYRILLHFINSVLVFILIKKLLGRTIPALVGALFFAVNSVSQSAVTWFAAHGTLPATTMVVVSLLALLKGIRFNEKEEGKVNKKWLIISFAALYVSFLFKQIAVFMFLLFPLAIFFYTPPAKRRNLSNYLSKKYFPIFLTFILFIGFWVVKFKSISGPSALFLNSTSPDFYQTLLARSILYPLTSFSLIFVPPEFFLNFGRFVTNIYYPIFPPEQFILIAQTVVLDMLAILLSFSLFVLLFFLSRKTDDKNKKILWFFVLFSLFSFLPYVVVAKSFAYLESRYYYLAAISSAFILSWLVNVVWLKSKRVGVALSLFSLLLVATHGLTVERDVARQAELARERESFLSQLTTIKPTLENKSNMFLVTGSDDFYLSGNKAPFQNGVGHILAVWYFYHTGGVPVELIKTGRLFELGSQGYFEYEGLGFGYFSDTNRLKEAIAKYNLSSATIVALYYDAKGKNIIDVTPKIKDEL